jgi:dolichol kinase
MISQIILTVIILVAIVLVLVFTELSYRRLELPTEITRKFAHFTSTLSTILFPFIFTSHWSVLVLAVFFFLILFFSRHGSNLNSIHKIERKSVGSFILPAAIYVTFLVSWLLGEKFFYILPILILGICDPMASILGMNLKRKNRQIHFFGHTLQKTVLGTLSFLVCSFLISVIALYLFMGVFNLKTFWLALAVSVVATGTEMFAGKGWDNLFIPLSVQLVLILFLS